jgi:hypothetical protein
VKLEGSLDAFSLRDIFQLLSFTRKTGGLHLRAGQSDGVVYFAEGAITGASADAWRQSLARRLVGTGTVDDDALAAAIERAQGGESVGVARALLDAGVVDPAALEHAAREQAVDAVFDLLRWTEGDFAFSVDQHNPDDVGVLVGTDEVVGEAVARQESWESLSAVIPSTAAVLGLPVALAEDPTLSRDEWALVALVDGHRTVEDLMDLTGGGHHAVVSRLAALVQRGLLEVRDPANGDHVGVLQRRLALFAPLERQTFEPAEAQAPNPNQAPSGVASAGANGSFDEDYVGEVVPARPEPFLPRRQAEYEEGPLPARGRVVHTALGVETEGSSAVATETVASALIERDPSVNRSLMLRLIAGVRGL